MIEKNEDLLLKFIKYSPIFIILIVSIIITSFLTIQNTNNLEKEIKEFEQSYMKSQKTLIKNEVDSILRNLENEKDSSLEDLKNNIKNRVYEAYAVIDSIYKNNKNLSNDKILNLIKTSLRNIRFNEGRGYYFIDDINGVKILQPINPKLEGKSFYDYEDVNGYKFSRKIVEVIKNNSESFDEYYWNKSNVQYKTFKKISFYKSFKPLNIAIGTGEYFDDYNKDLQKHILKEHITNQLFGNNGYVFVIDYEGTYLSHAKKEYIGKNRINLKDKNGFEITKELIKAAKIDYQYINYIGTFMPESGIHSKKTTYVRSYKPWNWVIASGFYDVEMQSIITKKREKLNKYNKEYLSKILLISIIVTIFLIILSIYISSIVRKFFISYSNKIRTEEKISREKDNIMHHQSKMALMGEMIENIAHQWKQPLSAISTAASGIVMNKEYGVKDEKLEISSLNHITANVKYLSHTIDDFRDFFNSKKEKEEFVIAKTIEKTLLLLSSKFRNDKIMLVSDMCDAKINSLENEFIQVLMNILNNAKDALQDVKGEKYIFIKVKEENNHVIIDISDNAGGINSSIIDKIFDSNFTTKSNTNGTGIGLFMTKEIVTEHMEGTIIVKNENILYNNQKYIGANFKITLNKAST